MSERSHRIARRRIEKDILFIISQVDTESTFKLSFDMVGRILFIMGVFKVLYNEKYAQSNDSSTSCSSISFNIKSNKERVFHESLWAMLKSPLGDFVQVSLLKDVLLVLYDSHYIAASILSDKLKSTAPDKHIEMLERHDNSACDILVSGFKELCNEPFYASVSSWLRSNEVRRLQFAGHCFSPAIDSRSRAIDERRIRAYVLSSPNKDEDEWSMSEVPDEKESAAVGSSSRGVGEFWCNLLGERLSPTIDARIDRMYAKRRQSLDKLDLIRYKETERLREQCTFKPVTVSSSRRHSVKPLYNSSVLPIATASPGKPKLQLQRSKSYNSARSGQRL